MRFKLLILGLLILAGGCARKGGKKTKEKAIEVPVMQLYSTDTVLYKDYVSDIQAVKNVEIRARVQGYLESIYVDEGQMVKKGQLLFHISNKEYLIAFNKAKSNVANARAEAKIAELEVQRTKSLVDKKVISATELELAQAKLMAAKAKVQEALSVQSSTQANLSYASIHAPFNGIIDRIPFKIGSLIEKGTMLTSLSDTREMFAYFNVSESEYLHIRKTLKDGALAQNNSVDLILADGTPYRYSGKIEAEGGEFNDNTGSISFRARFPNPDLILRHGASGKVHVITKLNNTVLVPQKSVFEIQDKSFVYIVDSSNHVNMKSFVPEGQIAQCYIVKSGLKAGDKIAYEGIQSLKDGSLIKPVMEGEEGNNRKKKKKSSHNISSGEDSTSESATKPVAAKIN